MNYFKLFELNQKFDVDLAQLSAKYHQLQNECHPDNMAMHCDALQLKGLQQSTLVNDGYQQLKDPLLRAKHLLFLQGIDVESEHTIQDFDFLMQQMLWREQLAQLEQKLTETTKLEIDFNYIESKYIESKYQELLRQSKDQYKKLMIIMSAQLNQQQWQEALQELHRLFFIRKFMGELDKLEDKLGQ